MFRRETEHNDLIPLSEDVFRLIRDLIRDYCGIFFDDGSRYLIEKRLSRRVRLNHLDNFRDYYRLLLYDKNREDELSAIIDIITINETYFFREQNQLKAFTDEILPVLRNDCRESRKLRIWSAGCSTGEEPYTIAMLILEYGGMHGWDIEILGSDINQRVLASARRGVYRKNSFRSPQEYFTNKYFKEEGGGAFVISDKVKELVNFCHLNLLDPFRVRFLGQMDVIFCRNVLIYFDHEARKRVADNFYGRLSNGGYLLLGHVESLMNVSTSFALTHLKNDMVYRKPSALGEHAHV
ncbi:MAG TPA: protein-glutamate O-methyltransferase CheR [Thermodesulfovibrionales bacterium]|nr:protein-glutamate O-methyltransferase CheR [Thermodesulfovibrionales bacterium]